MLPGQGLLDIAMQSFASHPADIITFREISDEEQLGKTISHEWELLYSFWSRAYDAKGSDRVRRAGLSKLRLGDNPEI